MTNTKTTKRALLASVISLFICLSMLVGSTFAWFTDSATTGVNKIQSGNLDLVLEYRNASGAWVEVGTDTKLFKDGALWEPGYTDVAYIRIRNNGSLAFKYSLAANVTNEIEGVNVDGQSFKLSDYIQFGQVESTTEIAKYATREEAQNAVAGKTDVLKTYNKAATLNEGEMIYIALVAYMPTNVGNVANHNGTAPSVDFGLSVLATQATVENDSFNNEYDKNALFDNEVMVTNDAELMQALTNNDIDTIYLSGNFGATTLPLGTDGVSLIATNGATMESLNINGSKNIVIDGLTFDAAEAKITHVNKVNGAVTDYTASVFEDRTVANNNAMSASKNVTIKNCIFSGTATVNGEAGYTAVNFNDGGAGTRSENITVEGCTFNCDAVAYIYINYPCANSKVIIKGNTFGGEGYSVTWAAAAVQQGNNVDVQIINNIFNSWDEADSAVKVGRANSTAAALIKATVTGNTFNGTVADTACVIEIRRTGNTGHTISGNTYNITDRNFDDSVITVDGNDLAAATAVWYRQYSQNLPI